MKGYIRQRSPSSWQIVYDAPKKRNGERNQKYLTIRGSRADAEAKLHEILNPPKPVIVKPATVFVYAIQGSAYIKVGIAAEPEERIRELQVGNPFNLKLLWTIAHTERALAAEQERRIHSCYQDDRLQGEWFNYSDALAHLPARWEEVFGEPRDFGYWLTDPDPIPIPATQPEQSDIEPIPTGWFFHDVDLQEPAPVEPVEQASYAPDEAAIVLGIPESEVAALIDSGVIPAVRMDTRGVAAAQSASPVRIRHKDLVAYRDSA